MPGRLSISIVCFHISAALAVIAMPLIVFGMWFAGVGSPIWLLVSVSLICVSLASAELPAADS